MRHIPIVLFFILLCAGTVKAYKGNNTGRSGAKTTLSDPAEGDYDIKHLRFNLNMTDTSTYVKGDVTTTAQVIAASMPAYVFELDSVITIDSAKINGTIYAVARTGFKRTITLPSALAGGSFFTAQVFYHGLPPAGSGFFNGITHSVSSHGTHMIYTVTDPWVAKDWWPVKQSCDDKVDSVDMFMTVPAGVRDGSNGLLLSVDSTSNPGYWKFHWHTNYPVTYYLISIAIAKYTDYKSWMHFTGSSDSMLIQNFFLDTATFNPAYKANFDSVGQMIDYFSTLYGRYPFWQEKYGMCFTTLPGGMENQTMTTIGVTGTSTIAHELTHQWFGDNVTYDRWGHVWISEGFATFGENLYLDHFWGPAASKSLRQAYYGSALSATCGQVYVTDTSGPNTLFDQNNVYHKGMAVVNMLRYTAPADSLFFQVLRTYQQTYAYGHANTDSLRAVAERTYGFALDTFFNQWVYGKGYPKYKITWDQVGSTVTVKLLQSASCPATTPHFSTFVELQLHSASADTIVKVYNSNDSDVYTFDWSPTMSTIYLNPTVWVLCKLSTPVKQDTMLRYTGIGNLGSHRYKVYPNPAESSWNIAYLPEYQSLRLTDLNGRTVWEGKSKKDITAIPCESLPKGSYFLVIGENVADSIKLERW